MLAAAFFIGLFVLNIETWIILYAKAKSGLAASEMGFIYHQFLVLVISLVILGIPAGLLGSVLPLWIRIVSQSSHALGDRVGRLLTWNTLGAVAGVLVTGFIFMPHFGIRSAFGILASLLGLAAAIGAWRHQGKVLALTSATWIVALVAALALTGKGWQNVLSSGIFRLRTADIPWDLMEQRKKYIDVLFHEDGADATVSVEKRLKRNDRNEIVLRINGKPDASTEGDLSTQYLLGHLPVLARPQSKEVFVLGFGSGITAGAVLGQPIDHLTIAENCAPVLEAAKLFEPWNRGVLTNARTRIYREDARTVLKLKPQQYDIIISEPSNPWVAGIGSVFSQEFYQIAANRLKEGGIMAQWFHIYEMHDGIVFLVLRTFASVFPYVEVWDALDGDIILLGSKQPWKSSPDVFRETYQREIPRHDLEQIGLRTPESLWVRQIASQQTAFAIPGEGPIQSDAFPVLEYAAPRAFFIGAAARQLFDFDERTWQSVFAPADKKRVLGSLSDAALCDVFSTFSTSNPDVIQYAKWCERRKENEVLYPEQPFLPLIFRKPNSYGPRSNPPASASPQLIQMMDAQATIFSQPQRWQEGVRVIESMLTQNEALAGKEEVDWRPAHFAAIAARARFAQGDLPGALRTVELGQKFSPQDMQLGYLQRLLAAYADSAKTSANKPASQ
jgi:predicted membrane-bound spermidine synthase